VLKLYDTMTRKVSEVQPLEPGVVKIYSCGPTVYRDAHIGNFRSYLMADWIRRALDVQGTRVIQIKNITDVGHMRQELLERGEDKIVAAALAEGKTPNEIAEYYTQRFFADELKLNIIPADHFPRATDHVVEMMDIIRRLVDAGYAYEVEGNVYYDVSRFPRYGALSGNIKQSGLLEAVRVEGDPLKEDPRDFTLWKQAEPGRDLKWSSPWGEGFPGWHIECSAMSIKYLGQEFDIHTGGVDNVFPHHEGEIAQSEGYTGRQVVRRWVHGQHLLADGLKMAKSTGNSFIIPDIEAQEIEPLAFRYLCLTTRYKTRLNFTFASLKAAQRALLRLRNRVWEWDTDSRDPADDVEKVRQEWWTRFIERVNDNLDLPGALALTWALARSDLSGKTKLAVIQNFDRVLGLDLDRALTEYSIPETISDVVRQRDGVRREGRFTEADAMREQLSAEGYVVEDTRNGARARPMSAWEKRQESWPTVSSSAEPASLLDQADTVEFTIGIVASDYVDDVCRCIQSTLRWAGSRPIEVIVVNNGSTEDAGEWLANVASNDPKVRVIHTDHMLGEGAAKNILLKQSQGKTVILLDTSVEVRGDIFGPIDNILNDDSVGVTGPFGLRTNDMHHFHEGTGESGDMDAMQAYCFAFRRHRLLNVGLTRESFRFYRNLDLDYSFHFKDEGYRIVADPTLPLRLHEHRGWSDLPEREREELSRKNYRRFLDKWGYRSDLLVSNQAAR